MENAPGGSSSSEHVQNEADFYYRIYIPKNFHELERLAWNPREGFEAFNRIPLPDTGSEYLFRMQNLDNELRNFFSKFSLTHDDFCNESWRNFIFNTLDCFGTFDTILDEDMSPDIESIPDDVPSFLESDIRLLRERLYRDQGSNFADQSGILFDILASAQRLNEGDEDGSVNRAYKFVFQFWMMKGKKLWMHRQDQENTSTRHPNKHEQRRSSLHLAVSKFSLPKRSQSHSNKPSSPSSQSTPTPDPFQRLIPQKAIKVVEDVRRISILKPTPKRKSKPKPRRPPPPLPAPGTPTVSSLTITISSSSEGGSPRAFPISGSFQTSTSHPSETSVNLSADIRPRNSPILRSSNHAAIQTESEASEDPTTPTNSSEYPPRGHFPATQDTDGPHPSISVSSPADPQPTEDLLSFRPSTSTPVGEGAKNPYTCLLTGPYSSELLSLGEIFSGSSTEEAAESPPARPPVPPRRKNRSKGYPVLPDETKNELEVILASIRERAENCDNS